MVCRVFCLHLEKIRLFYSVFFVAFIGKIWYNNNMIPSYIHPFLWSYDIDKMDLWRDKKRIITNILNLGTVKATNWLFKVYSKKDIKEVIIHPLPGEWNKKSLNFWSLVLDIRPGHTGRKIE